ncbi:hypothetical protein A9X02_17460 [Mycobacterium malmoense]|nr:hypothetical protein A9X02_17460 [Mycobacterium malmoense]
MVGHFLLAIWGQQALIIGDVPGEQISDNSATSILLTGKGRVVDDIEPDQLFQQVAGEAALIGHVQIRVVPI